MTSGVFQLHTTRILAYCAFALLAACSSSPAETANEVETNSSDSVLNDLPFQMMGGKWADTSGKNDFFELWEEDGKGWKGTGIVMSEGDTVFIEHLSLVEEADGWYYTARIDGQNFGEAILFKSTVSEDSLYVFENPDHDFPQSILYQFLPNGNMRIKTRGIEDDTVRTEEFYMTPVIVESSL